jgi:surface antigen Omp85-like protein/surface antigen-like variable number repeat protein
VRWRRLVAGRAGASERPWYAPAPVRRYASKAWQASAALGLSLTLPLGCASRPAGRLVVDQVDLRGGREVSADDVLDRLATRSSSTLFGVPHSAGWLSVPLDYEVYDPFVVERDVQRVERYYRARGYYGARVIAARVVRLPDDRVKVELHVFEGRPITVSRVRIRLKGSPSAQAPDRIEAALRASLSSEASAELEEALKVMPEKGRFDEQTYEALKQSVLRALTDHGYAHASLEGGFETGDLVPDGGNARPLAAGATPVVGREGRGRGRGEPGSEGERGAAGREGERGAAGREGERGGVGGAGGEQEARRYGVRIDPTGYRADILLAIDPGPRCTYGEIKVEGLEGLPEDRIRATINLEPGAEYSTAELEEARHALLALNVFSAVEYEADVGRKGERPRVIPLTFRFTPAPLHTSTLGGGMRADSVQSDVHLVTGYEHANFLGGLRRLTLQAKPGVVLYPITTQNLELAPKRLLFQIQSKAELRQPAFLEARTSGIARIEGLIRPFLLPQSGGAVDTGEKLLGFYEFRGALGLDRAFFDNRLALGLSYNAQFSVPFAYCRFASMFCSLDEAARNELKTLIVPYVAFTQAIDLRDDPIKPRQGVYLLNDLQWADNRAFVGSGVEVPRTSDLRVQPDLRGYVPLGQYATLAVRASVGFALPLFGSYGKDFRADAPVSRASDLQLLFLRGFFSGGPNSNRGYPTGGVGRLDVPPQALGQFFVDGTCYTSPEAAERATTPSNCFLPLGGLSLWEASLELRLQLSDTVSFVPFVDASNVTRQKGRLNFKEPHPSTGAGLRYDTPVGPLRLDVGYALPPTAFGVSDWRDWGVRPDFLGLDLPIAFNIAFGEAF